MSKAQAPIQQHHVKGCIKLYKEDYTVKHCMKRLFSLPLLPLDTINEVFTDTLDMFPTDRRLQKFCDYICSTYIDNGCRYLRQFWNLNIPCHPNIYRWIESIADEDGAVTYHYMDEISQSN
ncbi:unnamed protein product [Didymodactylos carnosus]|uniref:Uncharacterized protein n=1 Tax=Didymodactylos carnosus TaxID=1234261 RepID=A0A813YW68_9BILA|nr:unnamed protein product [Didymodactylos carnosus]CAF0889848.1 unnamed protein product [Didymodactylos carnosus]CAF3564103.1 unnamed protein product [Didymodactylos carnosus]CAF3674368.1 unnamed protein product [Didymodactylos carnosus]